MPHPNIKNRIEKRYGERMNTLMPRLLNELGFDSLASLWKVRRETLYKWGREINLRRECRYVADAPNELKSLTGD